MEEFLIVDTNILHYRLHKYSSNVFQAFLRELEQQYIFWISSFTVYEMLRGAHKQNEEKIAPLLGEFKQYEVTDRVLRNAALLESLYLIEGIMSNQVEHGDKIIAATAILANASILTANARDFPHPYFEERERRLLEFEVAKKRFRSIVVSLLKPDIAVINRKIEELN